MEEFKAGCSGDLDGSGALAFCDSWDRLQGKMLKDLTLGKLHERLAHAVVSQGLEGLIEGRGENAKTVN